MIPLRRGQYQMQNQFWFRFAPLTKAWIASLSASSLLCMYWHPSLPIVPSTINILGNLLVTKLAFRNPSSLISAVCLLYYGRLVERRLGSRKFINFVLINAIISTALEYLFLSSLLYIIPAKMTNMYFPFGPYSLVTAVILKFFMEIPPVSYSRIFFFTCSVHNIPLLMLGQLLSSSGSVALISCLSGALSALLYSHWPFLERLNFIPTSVVEFLTKDGTVLGWLTKRFSEIGEGNSKGEVLPVAASIERQQVEISDRYEHALMIGQMHSIYDNQQTHPGTSRLRFLDRLFGSGDRNRNVEAPREEVIEHLMEMGFGNREMVISALRRCGNDPSAAANCLLQGDT